MTFDEALHILKIEKTILIPKADFLSFLAFVSMHMGDVSIKITIRKEEVKLEILQLN